MEAGSRAGWAVQHAAALKIKHAAARLNNRRGGVYMGVRMLILQSSLPRQHDGLLAFFHHLLAAGEELLLGDFAGIDVGKYRLLGLVVLVLDAGLALQQAPGLAALDAEQHQLARERAVLDFAVRALHLDVHAEVRNERPVFGMQIAAVNHVLLGDAHAAYFPGRSAFRPLPS